MMSLASQFQSQVSDNDLGSGTNIKIGIGDEDLHLKIAKIAKIGIYQLAASALTV